MLSLTPTGSGPQSTIRRSLRHSGFHLLASGDWRSFGLLIGLAAVFLLFRPSRDKRYRLAIGFGAASLVCVAIGCGGGSTSTGGGGGGGGSSPTPTSITLTTSNAKVDQNTPFILTATVAGQHPLTGTVSIYDYGTGRLGPLTLTNGQAQITAESGGIFGVGIHQLTAVYNGDPENSPSTSSSVSQAITGIFNIQIQGYTGADGHFLNATIGVQ